eukprot:Gb_32889 [translate_table: standard]
MDNQQSFWRFGEQLRLQANAVDENKNWSIATTNLANLGTFSNLSLSDQTSSKANKADTRRNYSDKPGSRGKLKQKAENGRHDTGGLKNLNVEWKQGDIGNKNNNNNNNSNNNKTGSLVGAYNNNNANQASTNNNSNSSSNNNNLDKRFKTLPPSESLPRNEMLGGYIFVCNNDTMQDDLKRLLFGLPQRYRDSVRAITPGLPLFLYNYTTHQLHGIFEAASFGGTNIDPTAWEDKKCRGESRFPAQVRIRMRKFCKPLEEDAFRPVLHHYDGPKFRLQLNVPETLALLDIFTENGPL